jgi:hypothetical protein
MEGMDDGSVPILMTYTLFPVTENVFLIRAITTMQDSIKIMLGTIIIVVTTVVITKQTNKLKDY